VTLIFQLLSVGLLAGDDGERVSGGDTLQAAAVCDELAGKQLLASTHYHQSLEGRLVECASDSLYLAGISGLQAVSVSEIDRLAVRGSHVKKGLTIGVLAGAGVGGYISTVAEMALDDMPDEGPELGAALGGALAGALLGGLVGAGIGARWYKWNLWYESEAPRAHQMDQHSSADLRIRQRYMPQGGSIGFAVTVRF
jgi:hypothetical protein